MYSVVLAMAMTGAGDVPAGLFHHGCCGGGYSCSGCYGCGGGYSCHGGHHKHHGCHGGHHHKHHGCHGCYGCSGGCWGGCYGGCSGWSCGGGCSGWSCGGGCYGSCYGSSYGCYGSSYGCDGGAVAPVAPMPPAEPVKEPIKKGDKGAMAPAPATIVVSLPADARLTIDDTATSATSAHRVFVSPELAPGREYFYTLKAEWVRDGKAVVVSKQVTVSAGNESKVTIEAEESADVASR